jgi:kinesin family member C2/C3
MTSNNTKIQAFVRIKPHSVAAEDVVRTIKKKTVYGEILGPKISQIGVFEKIAPKLFRSFKDGFDCTIFAYGQTGSGKTHSMFGPPGVLCEAVASTAVEDGGITDSWGLMPRIVHDIMGGMDSGDKLTASAVEIYQERVFDLQAGKRAVKIAGMSHFARARTARLQDKVCIKHTKGKWVVPTLWEKRGKENLIGQKNTSISSLVDLTHLLRCIELTRSAASHSMNERSSRSHCVVTFTLTRSSSSSVRTNSVVFVDLAGSERVAKSGVIADGTGREALGSRFDEARAVNKSLSTLGRVIQALSKRNAHVPYRDAVLTSLLRQSLGGQNRTTFLLTVCEDPDQEGETHSTLRFGRVVTNVKSRARVACAEDVNEVKRALEQKLEKLTAELVSLEASGQGGGINKGFAASTVKGYIENKRKLDKAKMTVENTRIELMELTGSGKTSTAAFAHAHTKLANAQKEVEVFSGIVLRQETTGISVKPSCAVVQRREELNHVKSQLDLLRGRGL